MKTSVKHCRTSAPAENTYTLGKARFQWLSPALIRLEWEENGCFEDRPTLAVINRNFPPVPFTTQHTGNRVVLKSKALTLTYRDDGKPFHAGNLQIAFSCNGKKGAWKPRQKDKNNLGGTARTLDQANGNMHTQWIPNPIYKKGAKGDEGRESVRVNTELNLGNGLISRSGWSLIDDSNNIVIDGAGEQEWVKARPEGTRQDWYFFGYGHEYKTALCDGARLFGRQPLPPRYAFGYWWSRYWAYSDKEIEELANSFDTMNVPIDVMVIDMDWHLAGWTGYTWDPNYFPDPDEFLSNLKQRGLKVTLNLHPADGVGKHEVQFAAMAKAMGVNPKTADNVKFNITDPKYMKHYFEILHHPDEKRGVDFWWMDWQQGESSKLPGLDTLPWINHLHWRDMLTNPARKNARPLIFSRFGGIGAGRYCIGFSGDTVSNWNSLQYQPYFTATASNVLYGYWSHDIGGHMPGEIEPELYTRWMQFGLYSPVLRTHTTKNSEAERRVWEYPAPYNDVMMKVIRQRYALVPYIYSECRNAFETGISLCRPMYYDYPEKSEAYKAKNQYMFGNAMLVAPVTEKVSETDEMAVVKIWLPKGEWFDTARGCTEKGGQWITRKYLLQEVPVFVRPGTVIPGQKQALRLNAASIENLVVSIYPGKEGTYTLYEDDGVSQEYEKNTAARITIRHALRNGKRVITIDPVQGTYKGFSAKKNLEIRLPGSLPPREIRNGKTTLTWSFREAPTGWRYDGDKATTIISLTGVDLRKGVAVTITEGKGPRINGLPGILSRLERVKYHNTLATTAHPIHPDERLGIELAQIGNRISRDPRVLETEIKRLRKRIKDMPAMLRKLKQRWKNETNQGENCNLALMLVKHITDLLKL